MSNIATALKEEITRLARKELRGVVVALKKSSVQYRTDIAALKRQVKELERQIRTGKKAPIKVPADASQPATAVRFGAKGFAAQRKRLGLSAAEMGVLLSCSAQSVYKWEQGKTRPRARQMPAIVALRGLSKARAAEALRKQ